VVLRPHARPRRPRGVPDHALRPRDHRAAARVRGGRWAGSRSLGTIIGTALGWSDLQTIALAVALAFFFGYSHTSWPLLRAGMALGAVIPIALASDTISIAIMEFVDNVVLLLIPGAMEAGLGDIGFWAALAFALLVPGAAAYPVNRWLLARGKGHAVVHQHHHTHH
jgi:hypothetical protein